MPKGTNQKLKLYYLAQILSKRTDNEHFLTMPEIIEALLEYDITADRKSIYDDIEVLRGLGMDIIMEKEGKKYYYYVASKQFEIAELMLLIDAIQFSKFITAKKSNELIKKLSTLASDYEAVRLKRHVVVQGRVKAMNEGIYYVINDIYNAMSDNKKILFQYLQWNLKKELVPRKDELYEVSPWALTWDDENYYLIAYDDIAGKIKHYRVDKMKSITLSDEKRQGKETYEKLDLAAYSKMNFGMFGGAEEMVTLKFKNDLVGVMIDRFGADISIKASSDEGWSETRVPVAISDQFFGWVFALSGNVKISAPEKIVEKFKEEIAANLELYNK